jgi:hypothetical protein
MMFLKKPVAKTPLPVEQHHATTATRTKFEWHEELRVFEANRRSKYTVKLDGLKLCLKSYTFLLDTGIRDAQRLHRVLFGVATAQLVLARNLRGCKQPHNSMTPTGTAQDDNDNPASMLSLKSLTKSTDVIAKTFVASKHQLVQMDEQAKRMVQDLIDQHQELSTRGKDLLEEIESVESECGQAWGR